MRRLVSLVIIALCFACASSPEATAEEPTSPPPSTGGSQGTSASPAGAGSGQPPILVEHNRRREAHCAPPLAWSAELARGAQSWADDLARRGCAFEHSSGPYGENLAAGSSGHLDARGVVDMWYREVSAYDFQQGGFSMQTGHFTQVVWVGSTALGCGMASCDGMDLWVCRYAPAGNMRGAYQQNVRPTSCR